MVKMVSSSLVSPLVRSFGERGCRINPAGSPLTFRYVPFREAEDYLRVGWMIAIPARWHPVLLRLGGRITVGQLLGQIQVSVKNAQRQQSERQRMRRAAAKAAAQADPAAQADRIRKSVEIWSKKVAILRTQTWFDAEQRQFVAQISAQLAGGEPLMAEQRNRVQSLLMKSQIREQKRTSAETEGPAPKAGRHWAW
jgi:hypothetical protein